MVFIPEWLLTIAKRNRTTVAEILTNYENFKRYVALNDQITLFATQRVMDGLLELNIPRLSGQFCSEYVLQNLLGEKANNAVKGCNYEEVTQLYELSMSKDYLDRARSRLFDATAQSPSTHSGGELSDFGIVEINHDCFGVCVPNNLIDVGSTTEQLVDTFRIRATETVLKRLYVHYSAETVHQSDWYKLYLELLWDKTHRRG